jgi:O-antigen ligase
MASRARQLVAPLYLFLCLIIGGSAQGIWGNMVLQLLGLAIIAWSAASAAGEPLVKPARQLLWIVILGLAAVAIQLIPLPAAIWPHLGGRAGIAEGYQLLGFPLPALPLSLTPYKSLDSLLGIIPGLAIICAMVRLKAYRGSFMVAALLVGVIAGILLGTLQVTSGDPLNSPWYLYAETNPGSAVGFFANSNHMATLLVIALPFLAALVPAAKGANLQRYSAFIALTAGATLVILVGIALNRSLAAYCLVLPVLLASALIILPSGSSLRTALMVVSMLVLAAAIAFLANSAIGSGTFNLDAANSVQSRQQILATTFTALKDYFPWGSGLGSFRDLYPLYEDPTGVTTTYVIHAHNDFAELALETGAAGCLVLVLFLLWWAAAVRRVWSTAEAGAFARAASIASAAMLAHSLVDFPLRTAAVSAAFGMCLALLADRRPPQAADPADLRPTRHFVLR